MTSSIPLTNRVRGPYRKLPTKAFFPLHLWPKREAHGLEIVLEKRGSVTYGTAREDEASKIFILSVLCV